MVVFVIAILVVNSLEGVIGNQQERNYARFVQNVDGLTNTFRGSVEECAIIDLENQNKECLTQVDQEYRIQFGSLIKLFGYESYLQELYQYWQADLQYWYDAKKIHAEYSDEDLVKSELEEISKIRQKAQYERLSPEFAKIVESQ